MSTEPTRPRQRRRIGVFASIVAVGVVAAAGLAATVNRPARNGHVVRAGSAPTAAEFPMFGYDTGHTAHNPLAVAITPALASQLVVRWKFHPAAATQSGQPGPAVNATPVSFDGTTYVGVGTGWFYALNEKTGAILWQQFMGYRTKLTCPAQGVVSSPAVVDDPQSGLPVVFVGAPDGNVYAFNAADGSIKWKSQIVTPSTTVNDYFLLSSPAVANGHVYIGTTSSCDQPLVHAGVVSLDQATGAVQHWYYTTPPGGIGGSVWSSVAVDPADGSVYVSTGNKYTKSTATGDFDSIVRLDGTTMAKVSSWTVPTSDTDSDFGSSPTLFTAPNGQGGTLSLVGACSKNGYYYALNRASLSAGPVWSFHVGAYATDPDSCIAGAAFDGSHLYVAGPSTTINGIAYSGSIRALNPATGTPVWEVGLPDNVVGTPTVNGSGVLAVGTYALGSTTNATRLFQTSNGALLATLQTKLLFAQPVWVNDELILGTRSTGIWDLGVPAG